MYLAVRVDSLFWHSRPYDDWGVACYLYVHVQFLVDSIELGAETAPDICIFGIKSFLECVFGLPECFSFSLIGLDVGGEIVELFLYEIWLTSTVDSLFLRDIEVI